jgi:hypothetical protein
MPQHPKLRATMETIKLIKPPFVTVEGEHWGLRAQPGLTLSPAHAHDDTTPILLGLTMCPPKRPLTRTDTHIHTRGLSMQVEYLPPPQKSAPPLALVRCRGTRILFSYRREGGRRGRGARLPAHVCAAAGRRVPAAAHAAQRALLRPAPVALGVCVRSAWVRVGVQALDSWALTHNFAIIPVHPHRHAH